MKLGENQAQRVGSLQKLDIMPRGFLVIGAFTHRKRSQSAGPSRQDRDLIICVRKDEPKKPPEEPPEDNTASSNNNRNSTPNPNLNATPNPNPNPRSGSRTNSRASNASDGDAPRLVCLVVVVGWHQNQWTKDLSQGINADRDLVNWVR